jgi:nucleoside-diphosphate-sugar epimerase
VPGGALVLQLFGSAYELAHKPLPEYDPKQRCLDISHAWGSLGWEPKVPC